MLLACIACASLTVSCGGKSDDAANETSCDDRTDNDGDGAIDCNDTDCSSNPVCMREHCYNLVDDDGDGDIDCDDDQCQGLSVCSGVGEDCVNGQDDDGDGQIDCSDDNCADTAACAVGAENCSNGLDDDGDGDVDCDDSSCSETAVCVGRAEDCTDGVDNDGDGAVDCDDTDCARTSACMDDGENCRNLTDDDDDGRIDCQDVDCAYTAICLGLAENCENGIDDDGDDAVDCADSQCVGTSVCVRKCTIDSDGDGTVDCQDPDVDGDGIENPDDNCPTTPNADQADTCTADEFGDACQDTDADGVLDVDDNCCKTPNPDQRNRDEGTSAPYAERGNACDPEESWEHAELEIQLAGEGEILAMADLTGDGVTDFLVGGSSQDTKLYLVPGSDQPGDTITVDETNLILDDNTVRLRSVSTGDVNGDGQADLVYGYDEVILTANGTSGAMVVYGPISTMDSVAPADAESIIRPEESLGTISTTDYDGDGKDDIVRVWSDGSNSYVEIYPGAEEYSTPLTGDDALFRLQFEGVSQARRAFVLSDFMAGADGSSGEPEFALSVGTGLGGQPATYVLSGEDLAAARDTSTNRATVSSARYTILGGNPFQQSSGRNLVEKSSDLNGDGYPDLLFRDVPCPEETGGIGVALLHPNSTGIISLENLPYKFGCGTPDRDRNFETLYAYGDLDRDGVDELWLQDAANPGRVAYYPSVATPVSFELSGYTRTFGAPVPDAGIPLYEPLVPDLRATTDIDGDGRLDLVMKGIPRTVAGEFRIEPEVPTIYVFFWP